MAQVSSRGPSVAMMQCKDNEMERGTSKQRVVVSLHNNKFKHKYIIHYVSHH